MLDVPTKIFLEFDDELQKILIENQLKISDVLRNEGVEASFTYGIAPYQMEEGTRTKEVVTIILASSLLVASIGYAVSRVLNEINNKPHYVDYYENVELRDKNGNILIDEEGKPFFKKVRKQKIIQPRGREVKDLFEANFDLKNGIVMKFGSELKQ